MLLGACGSSGPDGLDHPAFVRRAEAICRRADASIRSLPVPSKTDPNALLASSRAVITVQRDEIERLRALRPGSHDRSAVAKWLDAASRELDRSAAAVAATAAENSEGIAAAARDAARLDHDAKRLASALGVTACA